MLLIVIYILYNTLSLKSKRMFWISIICTLKFKTKGQNQMKLTMSHTITSSFLKDTKHVGFFSFLLILSLTKSTLILKSVRLTYRLCLHPSCLTSLIFPCSNLVPKIPELTKRISSLRLSSYALLIAAYVQVQLLLF